jgi:hypothetical protein
MQSLNSDVRKLSILGWVASVGHLGHIWTLHELKKLQVMGEQATKAVPPLVEAMKEMSSGRKLDQVRQRFALTFFLQSALGPLKLMQTPTMLLLKLHYFLEMAVCFWRPV